MALSGTIYGTAGNRMSVYIKWKAIQSTKYNNSEITAELYFKYTATDGKGNNVQYCSLTINGNKAEAHPHKAVNASTSPVLVLTHKITVPHNEDGTKSITISASGYQTTQGVQHLWDASASKQITLNTIPRLATLTAAPNFTDEDNPTITYSNPAGSAVSSLQVCIADSSGITIHVPYRDVAISGTSYTFNLTDAERKALRQAYKTANANTVRFYIKSVINGSSKLDSLARTFTIINAKPHIEASITDTNSITQALTGSPQTLIRYHSTASATMTAYPKKEATISTRRIEHNGNFITADVGIYQNVSGNVFSFIATDSRGNTAEKTIVAPMIDYIKPTANIDEAELMTTEGVYVLKCEGNYYNDTFGYTAAAAANSLTVKYRYKTQGGSYGSWFAISAIIKDNTYSATTTITGLDYRTTYIIQCQVIDKLNTVYSAETPIRSLPVFHWSKDDFVFEVPVIFNAGAEGIEGGTSSGSGSGSVIGNTVEGDLNITGNLRLKGSGNYGNTLYFGDGSYAYIQEPTDDVLTVKASTINLNGNVLVNGSALGGGDSGAIAGSWTPSLTTSAAVSSYSVRQGWYSKVGNVVSIGWQIKATINGGYNSTSIAISGCPYTPSYAAFGGGIAHNVYLAAGFCFEGWAIGTDGNITLRGQPCNSTAAGNLNITSTAYYPTGSGSVLTLGGSITFTV